MDWHGLAWTGTATDGAPSIVLLIKAIGNPAYRSDCHRIP